MKKIIAIVAVATLGLSACCGPFWGGHGGPQGQQGQMQGQPQGGMQQGNGGGQPR
ncbi:MAG: hypothetical protein Q4A81_00980 [Pasteurellaceae bacterium]|nr:hypothetical protein [Pasteurellaceae bacterium]